MQTSTERAAAFESSIKQMESAIGPESKQGSTPRVKVMYGEYNTIGSLGYNGEKNAGEFGPIRNYVMDYNGLRARSWQVLIESDVAATIIKKFVEWVIGPGLKLQSEPEMEVLEAAKITLDRQSWSRTVESRFRLYAKSRMSDIADMTPLDLMESEAYKSMLVGGDVLVVLKYEGDCVKVKLIDGVYVQSPRGNNVMPIKADNGNKIYHGVEVDANGQHVAYHVRKPSDVGFMYETQRIPARGFKSDAQVAFMVYGSKYRIDSYRGMPLLSIILETVKKLERYKEATVGGAEERQKIAYFFEHELGSSNENPLTRQTMLARDYDNHDGRLVPIDDYGQQLADRVTATTNRQAFNMPLAAKVNALDPKQEISFKDFFTTNVMLLCAAVGIPYEVALSVFGNNYSASRASIKQWEHTINVERKRFSKQFMQPIYDFWLECEILTRKINAPGYLRALFFNDDRMVMEAFRNARFVGPNVPHIDPEKEMKAARIALGDAGTSIPLSTVEDITEMVGTGDSDTNLEQFSEELKKSKSLGIKLEQPPVTKPGQPGKPSKKK